jgi:hypothetical protein
MAARLSHELALDKVRPRPRGPNRRKDTIYPPFALLSDGDFCPRILYNGCQMDKTST